MKNFNKINSLYLLVFILFFLLTSFFLLPKSTQAISIPKSVSISALIGYKANIYGYSAPNAKVELVATNAQATTYSNKYGYWQFRKIYLPPIASEICFYLTDNQNLSAPPTCIPTPPANDFTSNIGPIILPPTIAINSANISPDSTVASSGQSIPNTPIQIHFFRTEQSRLFPAVYAYSLPSLDALTDKNGFFNFSLPTAYSTSYKFFATNNHPDLGPSPISHTLNLSLPSFWQIYQQIIITLVLFFITLALFIYFLFKNHQVQTGYRLIPALYPNSLALYPKTLTITSCPLPKNS